MARRRVPETPELDVIPVMSLIVHLIPMLLLTVSFLAFAQLRAAGPVIPASPAPSTQAYAEQQREIVSVAIDSEGFRVGGAPELDPRLPCTGACAPDTYDYIGLNAAMIVAKAAHPTETRVVVAPSPDVPYEVLVRVMDATRARRVGIREQPLFPDALIATPFQ